MPKEQRWRSHRLMSFFHEGWGQPLSAVLAYLVPPVGLVAVFLWASRWPQSGGGTPLVAGLVAVGWWLWGQSGQEGLSTGAFVSALVLFGPALVVAGFFLLEARHRSALAAESAKRRIPADDGWR